MEYEFTPEQISQTVRAARVLDPGFPGCVEIKGISARHVLEALQKRRRRPASRRGT